MSEAQFYTVNDHDQNPIIEELYYEFRDYADITQILDVWDSVFWTNKYKLVTMGEEMFEREQLCRQFITLTESIKMEETAKHMNQIGDVLRHIDFELSSRSLIEKEFLSVVNSEQRKLISSIMLTTKTSVNERTLSQHKKMIDISICDINSIQSREILSEGGEKMVRSGEISPVTSTTQLFGKRKLSDDEISESLTELLITERDQNRIIEIISDLIPVNLQTTQVGVKGWVTSRDGTHNVFFSLHTQHGYQKAVQNTAVNKIKRALRLSGWTDCMYESPND